MSKPLGAIVLLFVLVFVLSGCVTVRFIPTSNARLPPKPPNCNIEVFSSKVPKRPYDEIGILEGTGSEYKSSLAAILPRMREQACRAGGDAIILGSAQRTTSVSGSVSESGASVSTTEKLHTNATVVAWK